MDLDHLHFKANGEEPVFDFLRTLWSFHLHLKWGGAGP
jgi:hypothetical protein